ncbi:MAG: hypothetical protein EOM28_08545 [Clostridia bacterium]|nr:hypothetical protein [Clostridia bacterium]
MIKAYLAGIASFYEGEDIEIQYSIYDDLKLICKNSVKMDYVKPAIVGQVAMKMLLNELKKYIAKEIVVVVYDTALYESIIGTLKTKNRDVLKMAKDARKRIAGFENFTIEDVSADHVALQKWVEALKDL